jgi:hypothetical protein
MDGLENPPTVWCTAALSPEKDNLFQNNKFSLE